MASHCVRAAVFAAVGLWGEELHPRPWGIVDGGGEVIAAQVEAEHVLGEVLACGHDDVAENRAHGGPIFSGHCVS